jgi:hypothetical protein
MFCNRIKRVFLEHPTAVGETYLTHGQFAARLGIRLIYAGAAALVHAIFPFLLKATASRTINQIHATIMHRSEIMKGITSCDEQASDLERPALHEGTA